MAVAGITEIEATSADEIMSLLRMGNKNRTTGMWLAEPQTVEANAAFVCYETERLSLNLHVS